MLPSIDTVTPGALAVDASRRSFAGALAFALLAPGALLASSRARAQFDLDVPYVQSPRNVVDAMLGLARVDSRDYLVDLGSGDGRIPIAAAQRFGTRALGIEIDPRLVDLSRRNAEAAGVASLVEFRVADLMQTDIDQASVVTMYLLPDVNLLMRPRLLARLKPGSRVVSHDWDMGDWIPDESVEVPAPEKKIGLSKVSKLMLWVIPAKVEGRWSWRQPADRDGKHDVQVLLNLSQHYQKLAGEAVAGTVRYPLSSTAMRGDRIAFVVELPFGGRRQPWMFSGAVSGDRIVGEASFEGGAPIRWAATREARAETRSEPVGRGS